MLPIGPLMIEHRLIERMTSILKKEADRMEREKNIDPGFLATAIEFFTAYTDRCHHGKEEDILYKDLDTKNLSGEHKRLLEEILDEHRQTRKAVIELAEAKARFLEGSRESLPLMIDKMRFLVALYAIHIDKEDKHFFLPCMGYFSQEEKDAMLAAEYEYDRNLIHQLYREKVAKEETRYK